MGHVIGKIGNLSLLSALLASSGAYADSADVFNLRLNAAYVHDSNLFRLNEDEHPAGISGRSDNILGVTAGLSIDKPISQQRFKLDASVTRNRYANYGFLDSTLLQYDGIWKWHLTPRISGDLEVARVEAMNDFADYVDYRKNIRTTLNNRFEADVWLYSNWHLLAGLVHDRRTNSQVFRQEGDFDGKGWSIGLRYDRGTGRTLEFRLIRRDGDYLNRHFLPGIYQDDAYSQRDYEFRLAYPFNDKTRMDAVVAYVERSHPNVPERDYDGLRGKLGLTWLPGGKLRLKADYEHRLEAWQDAESSYSVRDNLVVGPRWSITAKQEIGVSYETGRRRFLGPLPTSTGFRREDRQRALVLDWAWQPTRTTNVSAYMRREERDSNLSAYDYKDTAFGLSLGMMF